MTEVTPAMRARLAVLGRIGGLTAAARIDTIERATRGQTGLRASFRDGHACKRCPETRIPSDLPEAERTRRADLIFRAHMTRLAAR